MERLVCASYRDASAVEPEEAVGPSDGKMNGSPVTSATSAMTAITQPVHQREQPEDERRRVTLGQGRQPPGRADPNSMAVMSPPTGPAASAGQEFDHRRSEKPTAPGDEADREPGRDPCGPVLVEEQHVDADGEQEDLQREQHDDEHSHRGGHIAAAPPAGRNRVDVPDPGPSSRPVIRLYANERGERVRNCGGRSRAGQWTPPVWRRTRSR